MPRRSGRRFYDYFHTAERFYRHPPVGGWGRSYIPEGSSHALFVDVYDSTSLDPTVAAAYTESSLGIPTSVFSYTGPGQHYLPIHTHRPVEISAKLYASYLPINEHTVIAPIGASGGGVVALLGVASWIKTSELPPKLLRERVPCVILVAPGIRPTPLLYEQYKAHGDVPTCVEQLCAEDSRLYLQVQRLLSESFALLAWAGISVHVLYWPPDIVTLFPWRRSLMRAAGPLMKPISLAPDDLHLLPEDDGEYQAQGIDAHIRFCMHQQTIEEVRRLISEVCRVPAGLRSAE